MRREISFDKSLQGERQVPRESNRGISGGLTNRKTAELLMRHEQKHQKSEQIRPSNLIAAAALALLQQPLIPAHVRNMVGVVCLQ